ncbi:HAD superfamily hydrolase (TIGR01509 family)/HAD superfamily hydrolase (TIGR01549 family) [Haloactinospora alba]|uniref:HAD superfamily hydrolase (TIGR01509 family)/HAD superfamily hydrolase (TIGR01549 family) n=1 Tax=Haloactinospora alba TaxID=405555 RepID=A0A543N9D1_9ACTN|nr:HAD family hydrolase [Haloactinospora alba]TQN28428.1 HAD superfamily hydrolase (TIGR01509 family)/HAD superfamily hydrolase (TIGR01549 family) [Haloactinospora alba]
MARIRALAIDCGGTLSHSAPRVEGSMVAWVLSGDLGLRLPEEFAAAFDSAHHRAWHEDRASGAHTPFSRVLATAASQCGVHLPDPDGASEAVFSSLPDGRIDGKAARALRRLHHTGLRCVLACDTQRPETVRRHTLDRAGIGSCFHALVLSSELGWRKPHPRFYAAVIAAAGVDPEEIVFVGDTPAKDASGPRAHDMMAVLIASDGRPHGLDSRIGVLHRFAELPAYLEDRYGI